MKNFFELVNALTSHYRSIINDQSVKFSLHQSQGSQEQYISKYSARTISIEGASPLAQAYGISQVAVASKAGHLADYLGTVAPKFRLRPLWLGSQVEVAISEYASLHLPQFMLGDQASIRLQELARRLIELGFNAIMLGSRQSALISKVAVQQVDLKSLFKILGELGIKVYIKPNFLNDSLINKCPFDAAFRTSLLKACVQSLEDLPIQGIFWESLWHSPSYRYHPKAKEVTEREIVLEEVQLLEECAGSKKELIFYLPAYSSHDAKRQADWVSMLLDDMGKKTIFAFSAVAGEFYHDHLPDHPLWSKLRLSPDRSATPLLPIVNFGSLGQGEGLWPAANFDLIERFIPRCRRHVFSGVLGTANHLPLPGSHQDCQLWVAGQSLWHDFSPSLLAETWLAAFRTEETAFAYSALRTGREITLQLSLLRSLSCNDERRRIGDALLSQLKSLNCLYDKQSPEKSCSRPSLNAYFQLFSSDIKRFLEQSLQMTLRTSFGSMGSDELQPSFWTHSQGRGELLTSPQQGLPGSVMEAIYNENRFL